MHITNFQASIYSLVLLVALWVILFRSQDAKAREWAFGIVGALVGYLRAH